MNIPLISIIIPTYKRVHLISETLDSVMGQTYENWECLVVDDGSADGTDALLETYIAKDARFQYHKRPDTMLKGGNSCRNYGLEKSRGEFINWLDSDDLLHPQKLEQQVSSLLHKKCLVHVAQSCFFETVPTDNINKLWSEQLITNRATVSESLIVDHVRWQTGAVLWSRDVLPTKGWCESLQGAQEWYFHILRSFDIPKHKFLFSDKILVYVRNSNFSITRQASIVKRYESYLKARTLLLQELDKLKLANFDVYLESIYRFSIRYVKVLIKANQYKTIGFLGKILFQISSKIALKYYFGVLIYSLFRIDYFLKNVLLNN